MTCWTSTTTGRTAIGNLPLIALSTEMTGNRLTSGHFAFLRRLSETAGFAAGTTLLFLSGEHPDGCRSPRISDSLRTSLDTVTSQNRKEPSMDFTTIALTRQSTRAYDATRAVEPEKLTAILESARLSPSACNGQPYHFTVCRGENAKAVTLRF